MATIENGYALRCPSCGSVMGKPDDAGFVQCSYCGTSVNYHPPTQQLEKKNIGHFLEICKAALRGNNNEEAVQYANKVLEIEPENVDAWINKAIATFSLTTSVNNRYDEAIGYLQRAEAIEKDNPLIQETRASLAIKQSQWYMHLGQQEIKNADRMNEIYSSTADALFGHQEAKAHSDEYVIRAMNCYLTASNYSPHDITILQVIRDLSNYGNWINWGAEVREKIEILHIRELKLEAHHRLPKLKQQLAELQARVEEIERQKGLFVGTKINILNADIESLQTQIAKYERAVGSESP